ncbi:MAG TPA: Zn-dependent hydrolase [Dehalococcoidia bacterium]|nr:Zn-dependent hydrolase [Dehalococcoidia bacterium]
MPDATINPARLNRSLDELGRIGDTPDGMQRMAFTPADLAGREYTMSLMRRAGMAIRVDPGGNIIARKAGSGSGLPAIAMGSHTDTVPNGGKYDGALGVMGAIEVAQALADQNLSLKHPVEVLVFTNEEGTRFHRWLFGSRAMAGLLEADDLTAVDDEGVRLSARLTDIGGDMSRVQQAGRRPDELAAYFELHIEQGPSLHQGGTPIGVVTGITGRWVFGVEITGTANHAGTTPMSARQDALVSASRLVLGVQHLASGLEICRVGTVGNLQIYPNTVNVIPGRVSLGVEFRDLDMGALSAAEEEFRRRAAQIAEADGVTIAVKRFENTQSVPIKSQMQELVAAAAARTGLAYQRLPSGAGHDAQAMAAITDAAMIFVPSVDGVSHAPGEYSTPEDCANGAQVLMNLLLLADERL